MRSLFIVFSTMVLFGFGQHSLPNKTQENDPGIDSFLNLFCNAVKTHNYQRVMGLMDDGYRMEQHDKFHKGNTKRFLNELFCGKLTTEDRFKCIKFDKVLDIETASKGEGESEVAIMMRVSDKKSKIDVLLTVKIVFKKGVKQYGIVGAVG